MTNRELEQRLAEAVKRAAPNDLEAILSRCGEQNGSVAELKQLQTVDRDREKPGRWRRYLVAACAALVLLGAGGGLLYHQNYAVASIVSLDVNPSIELKVSRGERVISCAALNEEAAAVLFRMGGGADLKGTKLDVAVNAIVGALVQEGYMDSISSAILISVEDNDQARAARIQQELVASVDGVLRSEARNTSVLSQVLTQETGSAHTDTHISAGKAALVNKVMKQIGTADSDSFDQLAALSVEELDDLLETRATQIPIGKAAAGYAAEEYAGTLAVDAVVSDVDPELDELPAHYEVKLKTAWGEFEYLVDAWTGEILSGQKDVLNFVSAAPVSSSQASASSNTQTPTPVPSKDVGREAAKQTALKHAGLAESQVTGMKIEQDWDDGRLEYDVEFWYGTTEYDYTIDGYSCSILEYELDRHTDHQNGSGLGTAAGSADIGPEAAKAAALKHAGLAESQVTGMKIEQDWDDGRLEYDVEFDVGNIEYEYTIDGSSGAILEYEQDWD